MSILSGDRLVLVDRCVIPSASSLISCGLFTEPDRVSGRLQRSSAAAHHGADLSQSRSKK